MDVINHLIQREDVSLKLLKNFVEVESFSHDKEGVDRLSSKLIDEFSDFELEVKEYKQEKYGNHLRFQYGKGKKQILLLSHLDTVYPRGTIKHTSFHREGKKVRGPGVIDIKSSYVLVYHLFELMKEEEMDDYCITWLLTSDEEIGSPSGKFVVREEAAKSEAVLVLEPATDKGELKTARKGGGRFTIEVTGKSAHAGINPYDGANAIEELAYQIMKITSFADENKGTTINTGEIKGGSLFNVVPDYASAEIDVRVLDNNERKRIDQAFNMLSSRNKDTQLKVKGSVYRPPLINTKKSDALFLSAQKVGRELNIDLKGALVGGGSDGNYAAMTGTPVLDGLGAYGGYAHSSEEFLWIDTLFERTALVYGLLKELMNEAH